MFCFNGSYAAALSAHFVLASKVLPELYGVAVKTRTLRNARQARISTAGVLRIGISMTLPSYVVLGNRQDNSSFDDKLSSNEKTETM